MTLPNFIRYSTWCGSSHSPISPLEVDVSEKELIEILKQILSENLNVSIGRVGTTIVSKTKNHRLPRYFKAKYGGLKRFFEAHSDIFVVGEDHPFNPSVYLRKNPLLSPENRTQIQKTADNRSTKPNNTGFYDTLLDSDRMDGLSPQVEQLLNLNDHPARTNNQISEQPISESITDEMSEYAKMINLTAESQNQLLLPNKNE